MSGVSSTRRRRRSRRSRRKRTVRALVVLVALLTGLSVLIALLVGAWALRVANDFDNRSTTIPKAFPTGPRPGAAGTNILLIGSDSRLGTQEADAGNVGGGRSDALLLLHLDRDGRGVSIMSIMRDSWVDVPGHGMAKVNAAYSWGGVPLTVQTVEQLLEVRIDHVAEIGFEGFRGMTDALGGVDAEATRSFTARGHRFTAGTNHLNGDQALAFVRERYAFADADHTRVRHQQAYLQGIADSLISTGTLQHPDRIGAFVGATADYLAVDPGLDARRIAELGWQHRNVRPDAVHSFTMPTIGGGVSVDGQSYVAVNDAELPKLRQALRSDSMGFYFAHR